MQTFSSYNDFHRFLTQHPDGLTWQEEDGLRPIAQANSVSTIAATHTVTYIAQALHAGLVEQVLQAINPLCNVVAVKLHPLSQQVSCDGLVIEVALSDTQQIGPLEAKLRELALALTLDLTLTASQTALSQPGLLVMDMDSTMIQMECIDEIARLADRYDAVADVTAQAMQGKLDFAQSLKTRVACLQGVEEEALLAIRQRLPLMPGLVNLIQVLKQHGWKLAIASGGFTYFANYLQEWLELDDAVSNVLGLENGRLTGETIGQVVDANYKAETLVSLQQKYAIESEQTVAMGDGANDVAMMQQAHLGVAFHAKPAVQPQADAAINHQSLDALLLLLKA